MGTMDTLSCPAKTCGRLAPDAVLRRLHTSQNGLSGTEAAERRERFGPNRGPKAPKAGLASRVIAQFTSPLILIMAGAAIIMPFIGFTEDAYIILFVLTFNTIVGLVQEGRASRALQTLESLFGKTATVRRDGRPVEIPAEDITVGDIVILKEGDRIPADGRFIADSGLRVDESSLTGESVLVNKTSAALDELTADAALGDIRNAAYAQTAVVSGNAVMVVSAVGADTEFGRIAATLLGKQTDPPLVKKVADLSRFIALSVLIFSGALFAVGLVMGERPVTLLATIVSLAASIIPEGLPIVLTLVLASSVRRMANNNAVVKRLNAVEGLGQVQVICTDKTGTLTQNKLVIQHVRTLDELYRVEGIGFSPAGAVLSSEGHVRYGAVSDLDAIGLACRLFGDDSLRQAEDGSWHAVHDPIQGAMLAMSGRYGVPQDDWDLVEEVPFSYVDKRRSGRWHKDGRSVAFMAGSPESVLAQCDLDADARRHMEDRITHFAREGLRIVGIASRDAALPLAARGPWRFLGFLTMGDTLRPDVIESIAWCRAQGIRVVMITGDHPQTAFSIAQAAGIAESSEQVLNGTELEALSDDALAARLDDITVFSRIAPTHKLRIVEAYRAKGLVTAMTGDGVNDAPALHRADIGVAMGKGGTDVAREAAHLVLLDDDFSTIVEAIKEGRATVSSLRRVISYLFSCGLAEALVITLSVLLKLPLPLFPGQIIWINLITDTFLDVSLGMEPRHGDGGRDHGRLIDRRSALRMLYMGGVMGLLSFLVYLANIGRDAATLTTVTLTALAVFQWFNAWSSRSEHRSIFQLKPFGNRALIAATLTVAGLHLLAVYAPFMHPILHTTPLPASAWEQIAAIGVLVIVADEIWKQVQRRRLRHSAMAA